MKSTNARMSWADAEEVPSHQVAAAKAPIERRDAVGLALAVMWGPFLLCALLSGDGQVWKHILMLPGTILAVFMHGHVLVVTSYIVSAVMTLLIMGLAVARETRGRTVFKLGLALALVAFCVLALLALLLLRA
jgi:hypothetical protein